MKKLIKICIFIILIFAVLIILLIKVNKKIIVNGNSGIFTYKLGYWKYDKAVKQTKFKNYIIYIGPEYFEKYTLKYKNGWQVFNENKEQIVPDYDIFAVPKKANISLIAQFMIYDENNNNNDIIMEYLSQKGYENYNDYYSSSYFEYDLDGDENLEKIISVTNFDNTIFDETKLFSAVFIEDNNEFYDIAYNESDSLTDLKLYDINKIIDIKNDNKLEFIVDVNYFSRPKLSTEQIYKYDGHKITKISKN